MTPGRDRRPPLGCRSAFLNIMEGHLGPILGLSWEDLGATWVHLGAWSSNIHSTFLVENFAGALTTAFAYKAHWFEIVEWGGSCSLNIERHIPYWNANIALARRLCSANACALKYGSDVWSTCPRFNPHSGWLHERSTYLFEMPKTPSPGACRAKWQFRRTQVQTC